LTAGSGKITGSGVVADSLTATADSEISLSTTVVSGSLTANETTGSIAITETDGIILDGVTSNTFALTASGSISDNGDVVVNGTATLDAGSTNNIVLGDSVTKITKFGSVNVTALSASISEDDDMDVELTVGSLANLTSETGSVVLSGTVSDALSSLVVGTQGSITQDDSLIVGGQVLLDVSGGTFITLEDENDFQGAVSIVASGTNSGNVSIKDLNGLELAAVDG